MSLNEWIKKKMQNWLNIIPAPETPIILNERTTFRTEILRSELWYRGSASELKQFFSQVDSVSASFWGSVPDNKKIRMIHSGLPAIIADTLGYIVCVDMDNITVNSDDWERISNPKKGGFDFNLLTKKAIIKTLVSGDGAFKIIVDSDISPFPMVQFIGAENVDYVYKKGVLHEVIFYTEYTYENKKYTLCERYGKGYISSNLYNNSGKNISLKSIPQTENFESIILFSGNFIMAVPLKFYDSEKYPDRGKSIFSGGKSDCFDALDEVVSQWWDALRNGRVQKYIPECLIPRNEKDGSLKSVNSFGTEFINIESPMSETGEQPKIEVIQPDIKYEAFVNSYSHALLMCLQGIVSPATLGIDVGKMQSAEAQREKKDVTGNTRNTITGTLEKILPQLITATLLTYDNIQRREIGEYSATVSFGEYAAPDFNSRIETIGKASAYGVMSVETQIDELWGNSKNETWKKAEVERIKAEKGFDATVPAVSDEYA